MYSLSDLVLVMLAVSVAFVVWRELGLKEMALKYCHQHCQKLNLQLLDDSVILRDLSIRKVSGGLGLVRIYGFEFASDGEHRYSGVLQFVGRNIDRIELAPHRLSEPHLS